ncbi:MAG TPA: tetratricopeptide repeat protein [Pyrinomonadaceae bacterium]|nr:tetratricopeptide repeat protein [Pyrinomonadaceae bacterium]
MLRRTLTCALMLLACATAAAAQTAHDRSVYRLSLPGKDWAVDLSLGGFEFVTEVVSDDGGQVLIHAARRQKPGPLMLFVALMPAKTQGGAADFMQHSLERLKKARLLDGTPKTSEYKSLAVAKYKQTTSFLPVALGSVLVPAEPLATPRHTISAYLVREDVWLHISLGATKSLKAEDETLFYSLLDSVSLTDTTRPAATSLDHFYKGQQLYRRKEYEKALEHFRPALELEARERRLNEEAWRRLVWEASNAYAQTGRHDKTKEVFEYGLATDPTYTPFHYGLARMYANLDDLDNTIASLRKALAKREGDERRINLAMLPDPLKDPAFARFRKVEKFRKALKDLR